jgi:hypothetical protein
LLGDRPDLVVVFPGGKGSADIVTFARETELDLMEVCDVSSAPQLGIDDYLCHITPDPNRPNISRYGLLPCSMAEEVGGKSTTGWISARTFIHFTVNGDLAERWMYDTLPKLGIGDEVQWGLIRVSVADVKGLGMEIKRDPRSCTGWVVEKGIPPRYLWYRFAEVPSPWERMAPPP